jgi:hypothetical protein
MATPLPYPIHSIAAAAAQIDQGEDPWFAIGCFLHGWWSYAVNQRQELIGEPPPPITTPDGKRWAAFCAATVEELPPRYRSGNGCSQRHPNHSADGISSSVEACLTISTNCGALLIRNPGGPSGRTRTSSIWQRQTRYLLIRKR